MTFRDGRYIRNAPVLEHCLVQLRDRLEVKRIEAFYRRELRRFDTPVDQALFPIDQLQLCQPQKIFDAILAGLRRKTRLLLIFALKAR